MSRMHGQSHHVMVAYHGCGAQWMQQGSETGHCCGCHRTFSAERAFEAHRRDGNCLDPATLERKNGAALLETFTDNAGCKVWRFCLTSAEKARLNNLPKIGAR